MKRTQTILFSVLLGAGLLAACQDETPKPAEPAAQQAAGPITQGRSGTVAETMNAGGYTYVLVDTGAEAFWAAAPTFAVQVGDPVVVPDGMPMQNFHSQTLNRDFDVVYFVGSVQVGGAAPRPANAPQMPEGHPDLQGQVPLEAGTINVADIKKAEGGIRIGDLMARKADLAGTEISVRGRVVKFNARIMGKNWLHLQDGTGDVGRNDLTVTTDATARVGDTVLVTGVLSIDKDYGYNYTYEVIIEDARVTIE